jgi:hypothetical protein
MVGIVRRAFILAASSRPLVDIHLLFATPAELLYRLHQCLESPGRKLRMAQEHS